MLSPALRLPPDATRAVDGGAVCLAFVNSVWWRRGPEPAEQLTHFGAVLDLLEPHLEPRAARAVGTAAEADPRAAGRALKRAVELREAIHAVCIAVAADDQPPASDVACVEQWLRRAGARLAFEPRFALRPKPGDGSDALDLPMWEVALSAGALLTSDRLERLRTCPGPTCGWVFVDTTRNGSRRWCDPAQCGNRERVRAHYHRTRATAG